MSTKIKRTVKDKLYFIVFGKYPEQKEEVENLDERAEAIEDGETTEKKQSFFDKAKIFFKKKSKEKLEDVKKNAKKIVSEKSEPKPKEESETEPETKAKKQKDVKKTKTVKKKKVEKVSEAEVEVEEENIVEKTKTKNKNKKTESALDSLKSLATEEIDSVKKIVKEKVSKNEKQDEEQAEKDQETQEKLFKEKTKMTLLQAEKKVKKWHFEGETEKVKAGIKLILEFFPNHEFRKFNLSKNKAKSSVKNEILEEDENGEIVEKSKKHKKVKSLFTKIASNPSHGFDVSPEFLEANGLPQEADINDDERVFGALSYFPLLSFFVLATRKDSAFAMYHAWQGFAILAVFLVSLPTYWIFHFIPGMGIIFYILFIILFGISVYSAFLAWSGRYVHLPVISEFGFKLSGK